MAEQKAPNFIRLDTPVVSKGEISLWISEDYKGEYPYTVFNALGYPVVTGTIKAKANKIDVKLANSGILALVIGEKSFTLVKTA